LLLIGIILIDLVTGPYVQFPIICIVPVGLAAWYISCSAGIVFSIVLVACRFGVEVLLEQQVIPVWATVVNEVIQLVVLIGLAVLVAAARGKWSLAKRLQILEGFLPICMFCKKIRGANGAWEEVESYVTRHSAAQFTHGFCETCGHKQYGEYLPFTNSATSQHVPVSVESPSLNIQPAIGRPLSTLISCRT
jgi:hypothetical protein